MHEALFEYAQCVEEEQRHVRRRNVAHAELYSNRYEPGFRGEYGQEHYRDGYGAITDNLIQSTVDTATSLQGTGRVKISFDTDGADWNTYKQAEDLETITWGLWQGLGINTKRTRMFRDAAIFGTGCLYVAPHKGKVLCERVLIDDIIVDESALQPGCDTPRQIIRVRFVAREVLKEQFKHVKDIDRIVEEATGGWRKDTDWRGTKGADLVMVLHAHHLRSGPKAKDGKEVIAVDSGVLYCESYTEDHYPYIFFHHDEPTTGFYGKGLAETLIGHQIRLNQLNDFKRRAQDLMSNPRWWVPTASRIIDEVWTNELGVIGYYSGNQPPTPMTAQAVHAEIYQEEARIKQGALELAGISTMSAHASRPEGIEHAVALRELSDAQARRHVERTVRYEEGAVQLAKLIVHAVRDMYLEGDKLDEFPEKEVIKRVKWKNVDLTRPSFSMQVQTSSMTSETPAGRKQAVIELLQYGGFELLGGGDSGAGMQEALRLIGHPDLGQHRDRANAAITRIEWMIGQMREGKRIMPSAFDNYQLSIPRVTAALQQFEIRPGVPERVLDNLRMYIEQAQQEVQRAQMEAQQQQLAQTAAQTVAQEPPAAPEQSQPAPA